MPSVGLAVRRASEADDPLPDNTQCATCPVRQTGFCGLLLREHVPGVDAGLSIAGEFETAHSREIFYHAEQPTADVHVMCEGWAFRFLRLRDGRRQILSFLIPGDLVSTSSIFADSMGYSLQALTDIRACRFKRTDVRARVLNDRTVFYDWVARCITTLRDATQSMMALGRLNADERIARLIFTLRDRLHQRGLVNNETFEFPLRQTHIADATGLTTVHVSRVMGAMRKEGLLEVEAGIVRILDLPRLRRLAEGF
jgi:CRP-like cAMP-binding protein